MPELKSIAYPLSGERERLLENPAFQLLVLLSLCIFSFWLTAGAGSPGLMEARNFITAREMAQEGEWLLPTMNGYLRLAKPPLPTWLSALSGLAFGGVENLTALRLPAALMATLLVLFQFLLARQLTKDKQLPFWSAAILISCIGFFDYGRQATWDIFCHSFMLGGIWLLHRAFSGAQVKYSLYLWGGVMLGLSFMSKGPVSFYAMLLPYLLAYSYGYGWRSISGKGLLLTLIACAAVCLPWPLYVFFSVPNAFQAVISTESSSWLNRHPQPFWFYWGFLGQAGVWLLFAALALAGSYAARRINKYGNAKFLMAWVWACLLLLSLVTEKKDRYLLPLVPPLALLTSFYVRYLLDALRDEKYNVWEWRVVQVNAVLWAAIAFALPFALLWFHVEKTEVGAFTLAAAFLVFAGLGILMLRYWAKRQLPALFLAVVVLHAVAVVFLMPLKDIAQRRNTRYQPLASVRQLQAVQQLPLYAVDGMSPIYVWEVGRPVDTLRVKQGRLQLPERLPAAVFSRQPLEADQVAQDSLRLQQLRSYHFHPGREKDVYYLHVISKQQK
ncbi:ArnT family glycosyltransferase [Pontibacter mangrovi]|nr:glycosyltransferase family 39 protein [Pontibacter mangrovi]